MNSPKSRTKLAAIALLAITGGWAATSLLSTTQMTAFAASEKTGPEVTSFFLENGLQGCGDSRPQSAGRYSYDLVPSGVR